MRTSIVKTLLLAVCAILFAQEVSARKWTITMWNYSKNKEKENAFTYALNNASDGDILEIQNDMEVTSDAEVYDNVLVTSAPGENNTITNIGRTFICNIHPGGHLTLSNVTIDCKNEYRRTDLFNLNTMEIKRVNWWTGSMETNIARMTIGGGATIKNVHLSSSTDNENAAIHVKTGAVLRIQQGAMIQNCNNESNPGKGGAICCDYGTIIMTGGTITGCRAVGDGGAIHTDGTRVDAVDVEGISARGDIYISGGYITNNVCGAGKFGGAIYLGNSGPLLHITGSPVITNNFRGSELGRGTPDDVSTYLLQNAYANRLKLVGHLDKPTGFTTNGIMFTGSVGVRYPDPSVDSSYTGSPQGLRFGGVWEYFTGTDDEPRNFFWNGGDGFRGSFSANSLIWSRFIVHELPRDEDKVADLIKNNESPVYIQLNDNYTMEKPANVPENMQLIIDLNGFNLDCDFHVSNDTAQVVIRDTSIMKSGTVSGHRDSEYPNAFLLEGGSFHTFPPDEWVASNRVLISNYCTNHPYMVASLAWDTTNTAYMADLTKVPLSQVDNEVRIVSGASDIDKITFSSGDWVYMVANSNTALRAEVFAVAAVSNGTTGVMSEVGDRVKIFDTEDPHEGITGREDEFIWNAQSYGLIKLIHITTELKGENYVTNDEEMAYFKFPEAAFEAMQRKTGVGRRPISVVDQLLASLGYNRVQGFSQDDVNADLNTSQGNGLRKWENIVTGTAENQLLLSTVENGSDGGVSLNVALADAGKVGRGDTGYTVKYDIRKSTADGWVRVGEIKDEPRFSVPLLGENGASVGASGFYRITTLIIPDEFDLSVTNEIPSTNIVGVLEVASKLTNTLAAVPWTALAKDPVESAANLVKVADYVHTPHLEAGDSVQVADKGHIYRYWQWGGQNNGWEGAQTVTREAVLPETAASAYSLKRNSAVWVTRNKPDEKPFFLIGQYSSEVQKLKIEAGTDANPVCTLVPNPSLTAVALNDSVWKWGTNPLGNNKDLIRIPNGNKAPLLVQWNGTEWGRHVNEGRKTVWKNDVTIPAGTGFWYMRCGGEFEITLPASAPVTE